MRKQILVIGLGQFGLGLVRALSEEDVEIIAVDSSEKRVQLASSTISQAYCFDATNEEALAELQPGKRDVCICATGDQSKEVGIICTVMLKQLGAKRVISRANDDLHARILKMVGADEVVNPEWDFGARFAPRIMSESIMDEMLLGSDLVLAEFKPPEWMVGEELAKLQLQKRHGLTLIAVRSQAGGPIKQASSDMVIRKSDIVIAVAKRGVIHAICSK